MNKQQEMINNIETLKSEMSKMKYKIENEIDTIPNDYLHILDEIKNLSNQFDAVKQQIKKMILDKKLLIEHGVFDIVFDERDPLVNWKNVFVTIESEGCVICIKKDGIETTMTPTRFFDYYTKQYRSNVPKTIFMSIVKNSN